jgi:outer membrane lipoprotein carrier protein
MLKFSNLQRNPALEPGTFRFTPPKGADLLGE